MKYHTHSPGLVYRRFSVPPQAVRGLHTLASALAVFAVFGVPCLFFLTH